MDQHTLQSLEFFSIKNHLKKLTLSDLGKQALDELDFATTLDDVIQMHHEVELMLYFYKHTAFPPIQVYSLEHELTQAKTEGSCLYPEELHRVQVTLTSITKFRNFLRVQVKEPDRIPLPHLDVFNPYLDALQSCSSITQSISKAIDESGEVMDHASKALHTIRQEMKVVRNRIEKKLRDFLGNPNHKRMIQDSFITQRQERYVIPLIADYKGKIDGIILDTSSSGGTLFFEPQHVVDDNNRLMKLAQEEQKEIRRILVELTSLITQDWGIIHQNLLIFAELDMVYAKAAYAAATESTRPDVNNEGIFEIWEARHPLLTTNVVPVDLLLGKDYQLLVITGPNTGGKTVSLKTLGLLTLMIMAGMFIPARRDSKISLVEDIFIDIGDEQSIQQNLSTFSGHIQRISEIVQKATPNSLILVDEIGAGTDPKEGGALGVAIIRHILHLGAQGVVTTHFEPIKNLSLSDDRVENASCDFDLETLSPTYQLLYGITGESKAFTIAKRLGLDKTIVNEGLVILKGSQDERSVSITQLNKEKEKYIRLYKRNKERDKFLNEKLKVVQEKEQLLEQRELKLKQERMMRAKDALRDTRRELQAILQEAKRELKRLPDRIQEGVNKEAIKDTFDAFKNRLDSYAAPMEEEMILLKHSNHPSTDDSEPPDLAVGVRVTIAGLNQQGEILEIAEKRGEAQVQIGDIRFVLPLSDLKPLPVEAQEPNQSLTAAEKRLQEEQAVQTHMSSTESIPRELNLLGLRGEDAIRRCEKYIEAMHANGREFGRVIHGKGEGILRTLITNLLKDHPYVAKSNYAKLNEGGYGVTEFWLK